MNRTTGYVLAAFALVAAATATITVAQRGPYGPGGSYGAGGNYGQGGSYGHGGTTYGPPPSHQVPEAIRRWEYAALRFNLPLQKWDWISPTENVTDDKLKIYRALGGEGRKPGGVSYVDVANAAGQQGWEITSVLERDMGTEVWFKRPTR